MSEPAEASGTAFWGDADETEALEHYRTLIDAIGAAIFHLDEGGRFVAVDDDTLELAGYARDDLLGEHVSTLFTDDSSVLQRELDRLGTDTAGESEQVECTVESADGERVRCDVTVRHLEADGTARGAAVVVRDVTADGRTDATVDERDQRDGPERDLGRERVIQALEAAREGISLLDEDGRFVYVNDAYADTFGYDPAEMLGEHWDALGIEADPDRFYDEILPSIADEGQWTGTSTCLRKDGSSFRSRHSLTHTADDELICSVRDVTEAAERQRDLEQYETIVEAVHDGVYVVDEDDHFTMVNDAYAEMTGYGRAELLGEHVSMVVDDDVQEQARAAEAAMVDGEADGPTVEAELETADGGRITAEATFAMLPAIDGRGHRAGVVRNVTERKRVQRRLAEERDMFAQGPAVVWRWENETGWPVEYVSENVEDVLGYAPAELESGDVAFTDLLLDEDVDRVAAEVEAASDGETDRFSHEPYRVRTSDGGVRWVKDVTKVVRDDTGVITDYLGYLVDITERKERERALEQSERRYRALVDHFPNGAVALVDEDLRYQTVGGSPLDVAGATADELVGRPVRETVPDELADELVPCYEAALAGESRGFEAELDAGVFEFRVVPIRDEAGEVFGALGMSQDVTARTRRERELERTERRFDAVFEDSNILVGLLEPDGTVLDINETAMEYVDADLDDVTGEPFWETPWWGEDGGVRNDIERWTERAAAGEYVDFEADLTDPEGQRYVLNGVFRPVTDDDGDVVSVIVSNRDVTERREIEAELREHRRQLSTLMDNVPGVVYRCRNERGWPMTFVSDACRALTGYEPDALERGEVSWGDHVVVDEDRDPLWEAIQAETTEQETFSVTYRIETADGEQRWVRDHGRGVFEDGEMVEIEGIISDITERKRLEAELDDVFGRVTDGFFALDENWQFTYLNEHAHALINPEGRELAGENVWDSFPEALGREFEEKYRRAMHEQVTVSFEEYYPAPLDKWFEVHAYPSETGLSVYFQDVTERKKRERDLAESERRYRVLAENFPNGVVTLFDLDLEYTLAAGQGFDRIPLDPADVEGKPYGDVWDEETANTLEPLFRATLDGEERSVELAYAGRDWVVHAVPITDERGDVFAGMTMAQDITERTERERELARYEIIVETMNDGIYVKDEDGYFTMVNDAYAEMTGYDRAELLGEHASLVVDEDAIEQSRELQAEPTVDDSSDRALEAAIQTADGDTVPTEGTFSELRTGDGGRNEVGVVRDISERKAQRRRLEESERRYRTLAEHFPNGAVGVYDADLRYTLAEGMVLGDTLPSADSLEGDRMPDIFPEDTVSDIEPLFRAAIEDGETGSVMTEFGGRHWQLWATPLRDADGDIFAGLSLAQDVTEQVEREQRLEELVDKLEASNERLEQFAYAASHDLQEPLRMVSSYLRLIESRYADELDADGREFIHFAVDGADRMRDMIEGLLKYSRIDTGGDPFEPVALDAVLADVLADLQIQVAESDAEIVAGDLPRVEGDEGQLRQVFQNLLDNAIEYSGETPPHVEIEAERTGEWWEISVSDEGIGMDPQDSDRVFEVFQSLHAPDDYSGTGIGLALCERIVERHGGDIWVTAEPGAGSTFTFTLPAVVDDSE